VLTATNLQENLMVNGYVIGDSTGRSTVSNAQDGGASECPNLRFQSSQIEVYARFVLLNEHDAVSYLLHRKAQFLVTDIVRPLLQVSDESVARLRNDRVIDGVKPGQTTVQVTNQTLQSNTVILFLLNT